MPDSPELLCQSHGYGPFIHTGFQNRQSSRPLRRRFDATFGLVAVLSGQLRLRMQDQDRRLTGPAVVFLPPEAQGAVEVPHASAWYGLSFDLVAQPRRRTEQSEGRAWCHLGPVDQPTMAEIWGVELPAVVPRHLCRPAIQVVRDCCAIWWRDAICHAQANAALGLWLMDYVNASRQAPDAFSWSGGLVRQCRDLIRERMALGVDVADLATATGFGMTVFSERFKAESGVPPGFFIRQQRLREACRLLALEQTTVAGIAHACGYRSVAAFTRAFEQSYQCTPGQWRRRQR